MSAFCPQHIAGGGGGGGGEKPKTKKKNVIREQNPM